METTTATTNHKHDLGITVSIGDLEPDQLRVLRRILFDAVSAAVDGVNDATFALTGEKAYAYVSYDGLRECGEHHP